MKTGAAPNCRIGTSGYSYGEWQHPVFYPENLARKKWFEYYAAQFSTLELNSTFYLIPKKESVQAWYDKAPLDFVFFAKGSRVITHMKRLKEIEETLVKFIETMAVLKEKLGGVLWQFPPSFKKDTLLLELFLKNLKKHAKTRHVFEFRHESWLDEEVRSLLNKHGAALCRADWPDFYKKLSWEKEPFIYNRYHGWDGKKLFVASYSDEFLSFEADFIKTNLTQGKEVFAYFNNTMKAAALSNAKKLLSEVNSLHS